MKLRLTIPAMALLTLIGCSGGSSSGGEPSAPCTEEGCTCIFAGDCPSGMLCVNGQCTTDNPLPEILGGDAYGDSIGGGDVAGDAGGGEADGTSAQGVGEACSDNLQCASGWCIDSPDGGYCSDVCDDGCLEGWVCKNISQTAPDFISLCVQDKTRLCLPCENDQHCGDAGDLCLEIGGGLFCGRDCSLEQCPSGYGCEDIETANGVAKQCVPLNDSCDCTSESVGLVKGCQVTNDIGTCFGEQVCDAVLGWVGCSAGVPEEELCDGSDNDCNGQIDEGFLTGPCDISNEFGLCSGMESCLGAAGWVCSAKTPSEELCNGLDEDCDDLIDEGFINEDGLYVHEEHCGTCGNACLPKFVGAADVECDLSGDTPTCVVLTCLPGFFLFNEFTCLDENSFLCQPCIEDEDCFGELSKCLQISTTDPRTFCFRDCSGLSEFSVTCPPGYECGEIDGGKQCLPVNTSCDCTAANEGQTKACSLESDFGICFGEETCVPELGWDGCTAATPGEEICDGVDNDCDGMLDEDTSDDHPCVEANEFGACEGDEYCNGAEGILCSAPTPSPEVCDGVDNDCNGETDEGFALAVGDPPKLKYGLTAEHCGTCGYACPELPHGTAKCDIEPEIPACVVGGCEDGYFDYQGTACLPLPDGNLCSPCKASSDCQGPDDSCYGEGPGLVFCGRDCDIGSIYGTADNVCTGLVGQQGCCPDGYSCESVLGGKQCKPVSGSCTCLEDGAVGTCTNVSEFGTCVGTRVCTATGPDAGWSECTAATPAAEVCDGLDNDCDGVIDGQVDSLDFSTTPDGIQDCSAGPACPGQWKCITAQWACTAQPAVPEECDNHDNDCDGQVDEDFLVGGLYLHQQHCGACGYDCTQLVPNSVDPLCQLVDGTPTCIASQCEPGHFPFGGGTVCMALPDNLCQPCGSDLDCLVPSSKCLDLGVENVCGRDCSADSLFGLGCPAGYGCEPVAGTSQCVPQSGTCLCGPDTVGLTRSCTIDQCIGQQTCIEQGGEYLFTECSAEGVMPEVCDGVDNDCDGAVDEGFVGADGDYTSDENCGVCGNNCVVQFNEAVHHAQGECGVEMNPPACRIKECATEQVQGTTFEWIDLNGLKDDGCECKRVEGNLTQDLPDTMFVKPGEQAPSFPLASAEYADENCDGIDGVVADALFVSAANALAGDGSLESPFQTIGQALDALPASGADYILVAGGVYEENIVLLPGTRLHGGYAPDFKSRNIVLFGTEIRGQQPVFAGPGTVHGTVNAVSVAGPLKAVLSGFVIVGYDVTDAADTAGSHNSYALYVLDSDSDLEVRNCLIVGGFGGNGAPGEFGETGFGSQSPGGWALGGGNGSAAGWCLSGNCNNSNQPGGSGGSNQQCVAANGPQGGSVTCPIYNTPGYTPANPGHDGEPGWTWTLDSGSGGACQWHATEAGYPDDIKKLDGGDGQAGQDGDDGLQGAGCSLAAGAFAGGHWKGASGQTGPDGAHGQAGGAGGASGGIDTASPAEMPAGVGAKGSPQYMLGATGGGGGAGGCGGTGGESGGPGGASVAVFIAYSAPGVTSSAPTLSGNVIERGYGGLGGGGGYGGEGGTGDDGGIGGNSGSYWIDFRAGDGGRGGRGGEGGGGGGGCGGSSFGIAVFNHPAGWNIQYQSSSEFLLSDDFTTGGAGGFAGPSGQLNPAGDGAEGMSENLYLSPAP